MGNQTNRTKYPSETYQYHWLEQHCTEGEVPGNQRDPPPLPLKAPTLLLHQSLVFHCMGSCRLSTSINPCPTRTHNWREDTAAKMSTTGSGLKRTRLLCNCEPLSCREGPSGPVSQTQAYPHHTIQTSQRVHMQSGWFPISKHGFPTVAPSLPFKSQHWPLIKEVAIIQVTNGSRSSVCSFTHVYHSFLPHPVTKALLFLFYIWVNWG